MGKTRGFTLIELVIVITIIGIIAGIAGFILSGSVDAWIFKINRNDMLWDGRLAIDRMTREIRAVKDRSSIITASSSQLRFIDTNDIDITYTLSSADLNRIESGTSNLLAGNVSGLTLTYYNASGGTIALPTVSPSETDIKRVKINITLTKNGENVYLQSQSVPRNF